MFFSSYASCSRSARCVEVGEGGGAGDRTGFGGWGGSGGSGSARRVSEGGREPRAGGPPGVRVRGARGGSARDCLSFGEMRGARQGSRGVAGGATRAPPTRAPRSSSRPCRADGAHAASSRSGGVGRADGPSGARGSARLMLFPPGLGKKRRTRATRACRPPVYPRWVPSWDALIGRGARESPPAGKSETHHRTGIDGSRLEKFRASREEEPKKRGRAKRPFGFSRGTVSAFTARIRIPGPIPPRAFAHTLAARPRAADATGPPTLGARPRLRERGAWLEPSALPRPRRCRAISRASTRRRMSRPSRSDRAGSAGTGSRR